jgi:hypothetical protein
MDAPESVVDMEARRTSSSRFIRASAQEIFDVLANPANHVLIDGSGTVSVSKGDPERLVPDAKFGMGMRLKVLPYRIQNTVVEFDEPRLLAWRHMGHHRWRYELEEVEGGTMVTETFDWSTSKAPLVLEKAGYPQTHLRNIQRTLDKLAELVEN